MLDLESEFMRGSGSIPTEDNVLSPDIFVSNIGIIAIFVHFEKTQI